MNDATRNTFSKQQPTQACRQNFKERLIDESPIAMYTCDKDGFITFFNEAAALLWGRVPESGKDLWNGSWKIYYPDGSEMPLSECPMAKVLKEKTPVDPEEIVIERPDRTFRKLLVFPKAILDDNGVIQGAHNTLVDISYKETIETRQSFLSSIVESSEDAIISKDLNSIITSWNASAERIFGYKEEEVLGKSITILIPPTRLAEEEHILSRIRSGKKVDHFQTIRIDKWGNEIPISLTISPVKDSTGKIVGASKIARDISGLIAAQMAVTQYTSNLETLNSLSKSISEKMDIRKILQDVTDATTKVTGAQFGAFFYNTTDANGEGYMFYTLSGISKKKFKDISILRNAKVFSPTFNGEGIVRSDDIRNDERFGQNHPYYSMLSEHLPVVSYLAVPAVSSSGRIIGGLFFGHQEACRFTPNHEELVESMAAQAAIALDNSILFEEVKELNAKKDEFIALASHELKTPLTSINGFLQILEKKETDPTSKKFLDKALSQVAKLNKLVSDLLDVSKIEAGKLAFDKEEFDLKALAADIAETFQYSNQSHTVIFKAPEENIMVNADKHRIEQVINNLLSNAVKYSPTADEICITIEKSDKEAIVSIKDQGMGLTDQQQQKIFSRFYRAEGTDKIAGLGIGLYLSKEIIDRHGGQIGVRSEYGKGSEFYFTLSL